MPPLRRDPGPPPATADAPPAACAGTDAPARNGGAEVNATAAAVHERDLVVPTADVGLAGTLSRPADAAGVVLFAHGSGSSRFSPRNRFVAGVLRQAGLATLLIDLLTANEEAIDLRTRALRFDIDLLARRLTGVADWLTHDPATRDLAIGLFGASTAAAAALVAAALRLPSVRAVVSRGGRPDLAGAHLAAVRAPTFLIVGGRDLSVITLNQEARAQLRAETQLEIVPGASHLFEEPGALEAVADLARDWFRRHLPQRPAASAAPPERRP